MARMAFEGHRLRIIVPVALFIAALLWKNPGPLLRPRFWAEEGPEYFGVLRHGSLVDALTYVFRGNYQLLTNVAAYAASFAPLKYAPLVTTWAGVLAAVLLCLLLCKLIFQNGGSLITASLAAVALALVPMGYEVYASATNIQWVCAATVFMLLFANTNPTGHLWKLAAFWVALCALTGVPSVMLAPAMWVMWFIHRDGPRAIFAALLTAGLAVQAGIILSADHASRLMTLDPIVLAVPTALQGVIGLFLSPHATKAIGASTLIDTSSALTTMFAAIGICGFIALSSRSPRAAWLILIAGVCIGLAQTFAALGDPRDFAGGMAGGRYYFTTAIAMIAAMSLSRLANPILGLSVACLIVMAALGDWVIFADGPSWTEQVETCTTPCSLLVWPHGYPQMIAS